MNRPTQDEARARTRAIANESLQRGDALGWFERLYAEANGDEARIPWADLDGHPLLVEWMRKHKVDGTGRRALVVGCGLGEDAEVLARAGFDTMGFDVSPTAIEWCHKRFPNSTVRYEAADLFAPPATWARAFDFVFESYTLQALPADRRAGAFACIAQFIAPGGELLVVTRAREPHEDTGELPWPLLRSELRTFEHFGLLEAAFEDIPDSGPADKPGRHLRVLYRAD
ncbi:MAG: class I SAM-dependent methyltransferase [Planctomycetes bacterium]|nr:class I SAM-dependent methyltransferase [Planctomycetota bacterium]